MSKMVLLDIEGTTTSKDFVFDVLFPYSNQKMATFLRSNLDHPVVEEALVLLEETLKLEGSFDFSFDHKLATLLSWIKSDRKHGALKMIQGLIWEQGYVNSEIKGHLYPEVPEALRKWKTEGNKIGIYSSGSVLAQKLIFKYSTYGDFSFLIDFYFDTSIGHKREMNSYLNIVEHVKIAAKDITFYSDIAQELTAAQAAGLGVIQVVRDDEPLDDCVKWLQVRHF